jgi:hypothetical protein
VKRGLATVGAVLAVALVGTAYYGGFLNLTRGTGVPIHVIAEGALISLAVLAMWITGRDLQTAVVALVLVAALVLIGWSSEGSLLLGFARSPLAWALVATLLVRLAVTAGPARSDSAGRGD